MIKDKIRIYSNYSQFKDCPYCFKNTHLPQHCPQLFYKPDKDFLIKRLNFCTPQLRGVFQYRHKTKRSNALKRLFLIQADVARFQAAADIYEDESEFAPEVAESLSVDTEKREFEQQENTITIADVKQSFPKRRTIMGQMKIENADSLKFRRLSQANYPENRIGLLFSREEEKEVDFFMILRGFLYIFVENGA